MICLGSRTEQELGGKLAVVIILVLKHTAAEKSVNFPSFLYFFLFRLLLTEHSMYIAAILQGGVKKCDTSSFSFSNVVVLFRWQKTAQLNLVCCDFSPDTLSDIMHCLSSFSVYGTTARMIIHVTDRSVR